MTDDVCDCRACHLCEIAGTATPRPDAPTADDLLAASDPHARPARRPRGAKPDATPGLFDAPERSDS